jgi:hypothetical protein
VIFPVNVDSFRSEGFLHRTFPSPSEGITFTKDVVEGADRVRCSWRESIQLTSDLCTSRFQYESIHLRSTLQAFLNLLFFAASILDFYQEDVLPLNAKGRVLLLSSAFEEWNIGQSMTGSQLWVLLLIQYW